MKTKYTSLQERLLAHSHSLNPSNVADSCRIWTGYAQKDGYMCGRGVEGYGKINLTCPEDGKSRKFAVHRVALVLHEVLQIQPDFNFYNQDNKKLFFDLLRAYSVVGLTVDHLCNNSLCFNPLHLEWVVLPKNIARKKWSSRKKEGRMNAVSLGKTHHIRRVLNSNSIEALVSKILQKKYRIIPA
jgi:hypothetical protein